MQSGSGKKVPELGLVASELVIRAAGPLQGAPGAGGGGEKLESAAAWEGDSEGQFPPPDAPWGLLLRRLGCRDVQWSLEAEGGGRFWNWTGLASVPAPPHMSWVTVGRQGS